MANNLHLRTLPFDQANKDKQNLASAPSLKICKDSRAWYSFETVEKTTPMDVNVIKQAASDYMKNWNAGNYLSCGLPSDCRQLSTQTATSQ